MVDKREMTKSRKRSDEIILVGYFLSRCTDFSDGKTARPPKHLETSNWGEAYDVFYSSLAAGRTEMQFRHTLRNTRDIFDSLFDNGRKGWSDGQKRGAELSNRDSAVHEFWSSKTDNELANSVLSMITLGAAEFDEVDEIDAPEGRLVVRLHQLRERNRGLVDRRKQMALREHGHLACEICGFDFFEAFGERGRGFIECHHTVPVSSLGNDARTRVADLALVCANCHRMIHAKAPWWTIEEARQKLLSAPSLSLE